MQNCIKLDGQLNSLRQNEHPAVEHSLESRLSVAVIVQIKRHNAAFDRDHLR